jgi:hypothetical protein
LNISKTLYKGRRRQSFTDVRTKRGEKGCAYFEIEEDASFFNWKAHADYFLTYSPLKFSQSLVKFRSKVAQILDPLEGFPGVAKVRKLWKGKIPWGY